MRNPDKPSEILYEGQPTHGKGSPQNPSYLLHPSKDLQGNLRPQYIVPPPTKIYTEEHYYHPKPIPGSQEFLADSKVRENLTKHSPKDENT